MMNYKLTSIRECVGDVLCKFAENNDKIFVIDSDLAKSTTTNKFRDRFPDRFVETGIAEQNAMSVTSGLAYEGMIPFYVNFAIFITGTCWTQVRQAAYSNLNIKLIGTHPGMDGGYDGASHHANEDMALMKALPNLKVLVPSNKEEFENSVRIAIEIDGPVYIRAARDMVPDLPAISKNKLGKAVVTADEGNDFAIFYEGTATDLAMRSFEKLKYEGYRGSLVNIYSMKPIDKEIILKYARNCKLLVSMENHTIIGGLGSSIADIISEQGKHAPLVKIGVNDIFTESGASADVKEKYGLSVNNVLKKIKNLD